MPGIAVGGMSMGMATDGCCSAPGIPTGTNVIVTGLMPMLAPGVWNWHPCGDEHCSHSMMMGVGYPKVLINGRTPMCDGLPLSCGIVTNGIQNVRCGG